MSSRDDLGAGPTLDKYFDLEVDERRDIRTDSGVDELAKDLSYQLRPVLSGFLGSGPARDVSDEVENITRTVISSEPRVRSIPEVSVTQDRTRIEVEATIVSESGKFSFVDSVS